MALADLQKALQQAASDGTLTFKQIAEQSSFFSLVFFEIPFAPDMSLSGVTVSPVASDQFTVDGKGNWGEINGVEALVTFQDDTDIAVDLLMTLPPSFVLRIPGVDWLSLGAVSLEMASGPTDDPFFYPASGAIKATITVSGESVPIKISITPVGDWSIAGDFSSIDFPSLSALLSFIGNTDGINLPDTLNSLTKIALHDVSLAFDPTTSTVTAVGVTIGPSLTVPGWQILPGVFTIDSYNIGVNVVNPTDSTSRGVGGSIGATLTLGGVGIDVYAAHPESGGWDFLGATKKDQPINLGALLDDLMSKFGVTLPASLKSFTLKNFSIGFNTTTDNSSCEFTLDFTISDTPIELTADLKLTKQNGKYTPDLQGTLTIGSSIFTLTFYDTTFAAQWTQQQGAQPLQFNDLASAFGFKDVPEIPSSLDLALTEASFTYDFSKSELLLTAISENYGDAIFLAETQGLTTLYAFGINIHLGITLADIPLVGDKLPDAENLGIQDAGIWILSNTVKKAQAEQFNATITKLSSDLPNLPDADTTATVLLSADLQLGADNVTPLQLSLGGDQTPSTQSSTALAQTTTPQPSDNTTWTSVEKQFGVFQFKRIGIKYQDNTLMFALDAAIAFGPLTLSMDGLSVGSPLTEFKPIFDLSGLGVAYEKDPLEIMGALLKVPGSQLVPGAQFQFDGLLVMKSMDYSLSAFGSYAQTTSGPSLFVFAQLESALGGPAFFFVTGLMAGFGFNRLLTIPAQDEVLDFPLLALAQPPAPGVPAPTQDPMHVLDVLEGRAPIKAGGPTKQWIVPSTGDYWLAAGIQFTSFELVTSKALLIVDFGNDFQIVLLGLSTMRLPKSGNDVYAYVEMQLKAVFKPQDGFFGLTAVLSNNSYVIDPACRLTGGFAFYSWFGSNPNAGQFVITLGGYHPAFNKPDYFPDVPRLSYNWAVSDNVSIKGNAYFALTTSCIMAGGGLEVQYQDGDLRAWFTAQADLLMSWHPFFFTARISVDIGVSYRLNLLFCHKTISVTVGASVDMWGPPTGGKVHVHLWCVSFTVRFGSSSAGQQNDPLPWSSFKSMLPAQNDVCKVTVSDGLYKTQDSPNSTGGKTWIVRATNFRFFTQSTIPASSLSFSGVPSASKPLSIAGINVRPMNLKNVTSTHAVTISRSGSNLLSGSDPTTGPSWNLQPRYQNVPDSLWGAPPAKFSQIPDQPTADVIPNQPVGYDVQAPPPVIGPSQGLIQLSELSEDYILPPSPTPISPKVAPNPDYVPAFVQTSVAQIEQIMGTTASNGRQSLFNAMQAGGIYTGPNGSLSKMQSQAGHIFADAPMIQN